MDESEFKTTILITGFGPFRNHPVNASWEAVKLLPELFNSCENSSNVTLVIEQLTVAYKSVSDRIKELYEQHKPSVSIRNARQDNI